MVIFFSNFSSCGSSLPDITSNFENDNSINFNRHNSNNTLNYSLENSYNVCNYSNLYTEKLDSKLAPSESSGSDGFASCTEPNIEILQEKTEIEPHFIKRSESEPKTFVHVSELITSSYEPSSSSSSAEVLPLGNNGKSLMIKSA